MTRKEERNGVLHPHRNTLAGEAWALFDSLGHNVVLSKAREEGAKLNLNANNIKTELCSWRKFHGILM